MSLVVSGTVRPLCLRPDNWRKNAFESLSLRRLDV